MHVHTKLRFCLITNCILVIGIAIIVAICPKVHDTYMLWGPQSDLKLLGITIDTWSRYWKFQFLPGCFQMTDMLIQELANPILGFNIYNPDKKIITDFTKN